MTIDSNIIVAIVMVTGVVFTAITSCLIAYWQSKSRKDISEVNDSVNHRHERGANALKLYDLAFENHQKIDQIVEWQNDFRDSPFQSGDQIMRFVEGADTRVSAVESRLAVQEAKLERVDRQVSDFSCPLVPISGSRHLTDLLASHDNLVCTQPIDLADTEQSHILPGDSTDERENSL